MSVLLTAYYGKNIIVCQEPIGHIILWYEGKTADDERCGQINNLRNRQGSRDIESVVEMFGSLQFGKRILLDCTTVFCHR